MANEIRSARWATVLVLIGALAFIGSVIGLTSLSITADGADAGSRSCASLRLHAGETLRVHTMNGRITYESWTGDEVDVESTLKVKALTPGLSQRYADRVEINMVRTDDGVSAIARVPDNLRILGGVSVDFHVRVPWTWTGRIELHTSNGSVTAVDLYGDADIETLAGPISVRSHGGSLRARTSNGAIILSDADTVLEAHTSNGSIHVNEAVLRGDGYARTSNGTIRIQAELEQRASFEVNASHGNVALVLDEPDVDLHLEATNGSVRSYTDVVASVNNPGKLVGRIGTGKARLSALSSNGSIELFRGEGAARR